MVLSVPAVHLLLLLPQYLFPPASSNYSIPSITIKFNIIHQIVPEGISFTLDLSANRHMVADDLSSLSFFSVRLLITNAILSQKPGSLQT